MNPPSSDPLKNGLIFSASIESLRQSPMPRLVMKGGNGGGVVINGIRTNIQPSSVPSRSVSKDVATMGRMSASSAVPPLSSLAPPSLQATDRGATTTGGVPNTLRQPVPVRMSTSPQVVGGTSRSMGLSFQDLVKASPMPKVLMRNMPPTITAPAIPDNRNTLNNLQTSAAPETALEPSPELSPSHSRHSAPNPLIAFVNRFQQAAMQPQSSDSAASLTAGSIGGLPNSIAADGTLPRTTSTIGASSSSFSGKSVEIHPTSHHDDNDYEEGDDNTAEAPLPATQVVVERGGDKKPCDLVGWIVRPVKGGKVSVEGFKQDGSLYHTTPIAVRINSHVVTTSSGSVYKLSPELDMKRAAKELIPVSFISLFRYGFPVNWELLVAGGGRTPPAPAVVDTSIQLTANSDSEKGSGEYVDDHAGSGAMNGDALAVLPGGGSLLPPSPDVADAVKLRRRSSESKGGDRKPSPSRSSRASKERNLGESKQQDQVEVSESKSQDKGSIRGGVKGRGKGKEGSKRRLSSDSTVKGGGGSKEAKESEKESEDGEDDFVEAVKPVTKTPKASSRTSDAVRSTKGGKEGPASGKKEAPKSSSKKKAKDKSSESSVVNAATPPSWADAASSNGELIQRSRSSGRIRMKPLAHWANQRADINADGALVIKVGITHNVDVKDEGEDLASEAQKIAAHLRTNVVATSRNKKKGKPTSTTSEEDKSDAASRDNAAGGAHGNSRRKRKRVVSSDSEGERDRPGPPSSTTTDQVVLDVKGGVPDDAATYEDSASDDDYMYNGGKVVKGKGKGKGRGRGKKPVAPTVKDNSKYSTTDSDSEDAGDEDVAAWSKDELRELRSIVNLGGVSPSDPGFWDEVASRMGGRSARECSKVWFDQFEDKKEKKKGKGKGKGKGSSEGGGGGKGGDDEPAGRKPMGKAGTLKRKREIRRRMDDSNKDHFDDIYEGEDDNDNDGGFTEDESNLIFSPTQEGYNTSPSPGKGGKEGNEEEEDSPAVLRPVNNKERENIDVYIRDVKLRKKQKISAGGGGGGRGGGKRDENVMSNNGPYRKSSSSTNNVKFKESMKSGVVVRGVLQPDGTADIEVDCGNESGTDNYQLSDSD